MDKGKNSESMQVGSSPEPSQTVYEVWFCVYHTSRGACLKPIHSYGR